MSSQLKLFWFVYWFLFINFLGFVDVELFVVTNFLIAFFVVFNIVLPYFSFTEPLSLLRSAIIENKNLNMFILDYFHLSFINIKPLMLNVYALSLIFFFRNYDSITMSRLMSTDNVLYKTLLIKNIKLRKLQKSKLYTKLYFLTSLKSNILTHVTILFKVLAIQKKFNPC